MGAHTDTHAREHSQTPMHGSTHRHPRTGALTDTHSWTGALQTPMHGSTHRHPRRHIQPLPAALPLPTWLAWSSLSVACRLLSKVATRSSTALRSRSARRAFSSCCASSACAPLRRPSTLRRAAAPTWPVRLGQDLSPQSPGGWGSGCGVPPQKGPLETTTSRLHGKSPRARRGRRGRPTFLTLNHGLLQLPGPQGRAVP